MIDDHVIQEDQEQIPIQNNPDPTSADHFSKPSYRWSKNHPPSLVIGNPFSPLKIRGQMLNEYMNATLISPLEPKSIDEALIDAS